MAKDYYNSNEVGEKIGSPGTGIIGIILGDQLHPPMVNSKRIWKRGKNWKRGAVMCTKRLADMAKLKKTDLVLDVGCGVGGPAIILARDYKCRVVGLNSSRLQLKTAKEKTKVANLENLIDYVCGDAENLPFSSESFTCVWTFNMFYHIHDKQKALGEFYRVLRHGGRLAFDDWMITRKTIKSDIKQLQHRWSSPPWISDEELMYYLHTAGFILKKWQDFSYIGKVLMNKYFSKVFEMDVRPKIIAIDKERGGQMANDFRKDVEHTIGLYLADKLKYIQFIATKEYEARQF